jgi:SAM-dependent methyltransferase
MEDTPMQSFARGRGAPFSVALAAAVCALIAGAPASAQRPDGVTSDIIDRSSQLDVPFVPSHDNVLRAMFELARPTGTDFLIDLGSGDGRIVINAARQFGLRGFGVDLNDDLVGIANRNAERAGVAPRAKFYVRDLFETDIRQATILTMYLLPEVVQSLRDKLLTDLRPGARIVSHDYHLADWRPDAVRLAEIGPKLEDSIVYLWVVPARVAGVWAWTIEQPELFNEPMEYSASLSQRFQDVEGKVSLFPFEQRIHQASLQGTRLAFSVAGELNEKIVFHDFEGVVEGDRITGTVRLSGGIPPVTLPWTARRTRGAE